MVKLSSHSLSVCIVRIMHLQKNLRVLTNFITDMSEYYAIYVYYILYVGEKFTNFNELYNEYECVEQLWVKRYVT